MIFKSLIPMQYNSNSKPDHYNSDFPIFTDKDMGEFLKPLRADFFANSLFDCHPFKQNQFPRVDIAETDDNFLITAELPGIDGKNVDITLDDGTLTIKGEKKEDTEEKQGEFYNRERSYGIFQRSFEIPELIDEKNVDITLDDGTLTIKGEKKEATEEEQGEFYSRERSYGIFQRSFEIPELIDENKIDASFSNGVLTVKMPKTPEAKKEVKKIPINS